MCLLYELWILPAAAGTIDTFKWRPYNRPNTLNRQTFKFFETINRWFASIKQLDNKRLCDRVVIEQLEKQRRNIQEKTGFLKEYVEPDFELIDQLRTKDVFSTEVMDEIMTEKTKADRIEKMLFHLRYVDEDGYRSFLEALRDSSQVHVVNFINGTLLNCDVLYKYWLVPKATLENSTPKLCNVAP